MMNVSKKIALLGYVGVISLVISSSYASCGRSYRDSPNDIPATGCGHLEVDVYNDTKYTFKVDASALATSSTGGVAVGGSSTNFIELPPGLQTLNFDGTYVSPDDRDKVDASMTYFAYLNGHKVGPKFILNAVKNSCNVHYNAYNTFYDQRCYDEVGDTCSLNGACSITCCETSHDGCICDSGFVFKSTSCSKSSSEKTYNNPDVPSSVVAPVSGDGVGVYITDQSSYSRFTCNKATECGSVKNGHCVYGTADTQENQPARFSFHIKPSSIETLKVTFYPYKNDTPAGKLVQDVIYKNIDKNLLRGLGTFWSLTPVRVDTSSTDANIEFSTLCNAQACPGA